MIIILTTALRHGKLTPNVSFTSKAMHEQQLNRHSALEQAYLLEAVHDEADIL